MAKLLNFFGVMAIVAVLLPTTGNWGVADAVAQAAARLPAGGKRGIDAPSI